MQITLLGGFEVIIDGHRVPPTEWRRRKAAALVKLLALARGRVLHRERVIDALWPTLGLGEAAPRLHKAAYYARRALREPRSLVLCGETVALFPDAEVDVDAVRFQRLAESARDARTAGAAADEYPGDLLPHDCYEAWAEEPRERLRLLYLRMLRRAGRWHDIVNTDPTDEAAHLELIRSTAGTGDTEMALHQFERLAHGLRELGAGPSPEAVQLRNVLAESSRPGRGDVVVGRPAASPRQPTVHSDGARPHERVLEALTELCRNHPVLFTSNAPVAVVVMYSLDEYAKRGGWRVADPRLA
jgi:DNA-binding SARP family transcriptional activator